MKNLGPLDERSINAAMVSLLTATSGHGCIRRRGRLNAGKVDESLCVPWEEDDVRMAEHAGVEEAARSRWHGQRITKSMDGQANGVTDEQRCHR
jgi:hypothetical protein